MVRWEPGTPERLQKAALQLYATRGFEQTTAADIAEAVGLTERTFFRHFSDKREVLFYGQQLFVDAFLDGVHAAPQDASPMDVVTQGLRSAATNFPDERRAHARVRSAVIEKNPALQERELHKMASLAVSLTDALRDRGIDDLAARLAAESGVTVFGISFVLWIGEGEQRSLTDIMATVFAELVAIAREATV